MGKAAPDLAGHIEMCWSTVSAGSENAFYEILPDGYIDLIIRFSATRCQAFLFGPATEKASIEIDEGYDYFCARFRPGQALLLDDVHPATLVDSYVELPRILGTGVGSLGDRLYSSPTHLSRQRLVESLLRHARPLVRDERCRWGAALVDECGGQLPVADVASRLGMNRRSLERLFLNQMGMTPKRLSRIIRLQHLLMRLRFGNYHNLTDLAYVCGYTDQSHMIRDLRDLTGCLPGEVSKCRIRRFAEQPQCKIVHNL